MRSLPDPSGEVFFAAQQQPAWTVLRRRGHAHAGADRRGRVKRAKAADYFRREMGT